MRNSWNSPTLLVGPEKGAGPWENILVVSLKFNHRFSTWTSNCGPLAKPGRLPKGHDVHPHKGGANRWEGDKAHQAGFQRTKGLLITNKTKTKCGHLLQHLDEPQNPFAKSKPDSRDYTANDLTCRNYPETADLQRWKADSWGLREGLGGQQRVGGMMEILAGNVLKPSRGDSHTTL